MTATKPLPTLTRLAAGMSTLRHYRDGKLHYTAEWWEPTEPLPTRHYFDFTVDVSDPAATGEFLPCDKTLRFLRWARQELERQQGQVEIIAQHKALGTQCMGCQAGWPTLETYPPQHEMPGERGERVNCTRDRDGA